MYKLIRMLIKTNRSWLLPLFLALALFSFLVVTSSGTAFSPFIYTLF